MINKYLNVLLYTALSIFILAEQAIANEVDCTSHKGEEYDALTCLAEQYFQVGLYKKSIEKYLQASKIDIFEVPNYELDTKLAHAYLLSGNIEKAQYYIERSRLALSVLTGIYTCVETDDDRIFVIEDKAGQPLMSKVARDATLVMCGAAYDYIYNPRNQLFDNVVSDGNFVQYHLIVDELIKKRLTIK